MKLNVSLFLSVCFFIILPTEPRELAHEAPCLVTMFRILAKMRQKHLEGKWFERKETTNQRFARVFTAFQLFSILSCDQHKLLCILLGIICDEPTWSMKNEERDTCEKTQSVARSSTRPRCTQFPSQVTRYISSESRIHAGMNSFARQYIRLTVHTYCTLRGLDHAMSLVSFKPILRPLKAPSAAPVFEWGKRLAQETPAWGHWNFERNVPYIIRITLAKPGK